MLIAINRRNIVEVHIDKPYQRDIDDELDFQPTHGWQVRIVMNDNSSVYIDKDSYEDCQKYIKENFPEFLFIV